MDDRTRHPVVVGAGLSGLLISRALSHAGVPHLLLGDPPTSAPRLGESLSLDASLAFLNFFPELAAFFFWKKRVVSYVGDHVGMCNVELREFASRAVLRVLGYRPIDALLHVDRIGLDAALFGNVVSDPLCHHVQRRVEGIAFDSVTDRIESLQLDNGDSVCPGIVFDATNHLRLVGRAAGIRCDMTSPLQRVAFTHLHLAEEDDDQCNPEAWRHSTSLMRLYRESDDVDGGAWCVPLGRYVSVGVSMLAEKEPDRSDEELLDRVHEAFERRGVDYRRRFVRPHGPLGLRHRYFRHERSWGANWLLVGPASCQVWWPSSTAVGTSLAAANVAAAFTRDPSAVGPIYQTYLNELEPAHRHLTPVMTEDRPPKDPSAILEYAKPLIHGHLVRLCVFAQMHNTGLAKLAGRLLYRLTRDRSTAGVDCQFLSASFEDQTAMMYRDNAA